MPIRNTKLKTEISFSIIDRMNPFEHEHLSGTSEPTFCTIRKTKPYEKSLKNETKRPFLYKINTYSLTLDPKRSIHLMQLVSCFNNRDPKIPLVQTFKIAIFYWYLVHNWSWIFFFQAIPSIITSIPTAIPQVTS